MLIVSMLALQFQHAVKLIFFTVVLRSPVTSSLSHLKVDWKTSSLMKRVSVCGTSCKVTATMSERARGRMAHFGVFYRAFFRHKTCLLCTSYMRLKLAFSILKRVRCTSSISLKLMFSIIKHVFGVHYLCNSNLLFADN